MLVPNFSNPKFGPDLGQQKYIWLILTRSNPLLKSAGDFPKIVSNHITCVKPKQVGFLSRFVLFSFFIKGF